MSDDLTLGPLAQLALINPPTDLSRLGPSDTVSFIPMADVSEDGHWVNWQTRRVSEVRNGYTAFQEGDILFAKITPCMENGKGAHVTALVNGRGFGSTEFHILRALPGTSSRFLYHLTRLRQFRQEAEAKMTGSAGQRRVPTDVLARFQVRLMSFAEQCRIAEILDAADAAIQATEAVIAKLKFAKVGLLHDLLTHGLDEAGRLRDPIANPEKFHETALGLLPKEWEINSLGACTLSSAFGPRFPGNLYQAQGNVATLRTTDMDDNGNMSLETMPLAQLNLSRFRFHLLEQGDLLISRSGTCGIAAVFEGFDLPVLPGAFLIRFRLKDTLLPQFARLYFNWNVGRQRVLVFAEGGVQKNLKGTSLLELSIPVPTPNEQRMVLEQLASFDARIRAEEASLAKLRQTKQGLMDDLLTGRVRVADAERSLP